jgi:exopolysaccharide production protein ExoQ
MCALVPVVLIGGLTGDTQYTETMEVAATGIFGSKNNFALHICLLLFVSFAVLADTQQKKPFRAVALLGVVTGPLLLWQAKSVGALMVFFPSLLLMLAIIGLGRISARLRPIALAGSVAIVLAAAAIVTPVVIASQDTLLSLVGKTGNLTGRGYLWYRAEFLIEQRPTLGVGYAAFWVQGNPEAEGLWRAEHITARAGFHFHNFYYETLVELGYVGLAIGGGAFALTGIAALLWGLRQPGPPSGFFCALMLFLFMRSFVELDLTGGFGLTALIVPAAWFYATSAIGSPGQVRTQWATDGPPSIAPPLTQWHTQ